MNRLLGQLDESGQIDRSIWSVDRSVFRAPRCSAGLLRQSENSDQWIALMGSRGG